MNTFDALFCREYDYERYNCLHFTIEAWRSLFGIDLSFLSQAFAKSKSCYQLTDASLHKHLKRLRYPQSPCLCLMRGLAADETHIATFLDNRIFHITKSGVQYLPPEVVTVYRQVAYYEYCNNY